MRAIDTLAELVIEVAGTELSDADAGRLAVASVRQRASLPAQAELVFRGADAELANRLLLLPGLSLSICDAGREEVVFAGDVTAVELDYRPDAEVEIRVRGYDRLHRLRKRQAVRALLDLDCAALAGELGGAVGLAVDADVASTPVDRLIQWHQSDLELLAESCHRVGLAFAAEGDRLVLFDGRGRGDPIEVRLGEELVEAAFEVNGDRAVEAVSATGWDPATGQRFERRADSPRSGRTTGTRIAVADLGGSGERVVAGTVAGVEGQVADLAQAALDVAVASTTVVRGVATGDPRIRPGAKVAVTGVAAGLEGEYVVTEASHTIDSVRGYLVAFGSGGWPESTSADGAAVRVLPGVVVELDDPDRLGRVRVAFPTLQSTESGWLRVVAPAAGPKMGFVALPSAGDEVLVLLPNGEPRFGLVIGGLYTADDPPDFGVEDGQVRRYTWRTSHGEEIALDTERGRVSLRTPNGSRVALGEDGFSIHAATNLDIEAPGKTIRIRAKAIDFVRAAADD